MITAPEEHTITETALVLCPSCKGEVLAAYQTHGANNQPYSTGPKFLSAVCKDCGYDLGIERKV